MVSESTARLRPHQIFRSDRHSSAVLLGAAALGLILANGPFAEALLSAKEFHLAIPALGLDLGVGHWIADLLLAVFFFVVAAELKYELTFGQLNSIRKALVPAIAALGGVIAPALVFLALSGGGDLARGWPVPTATDIAFALGVLAVFGRGLPPHLRVFLLALAVLDDLVGIVLIAVLFADGIQFVPLLGALFVLAIFWFVSRGAVRGRMLRGTVLLILALVCWYLVVLSGIHPTLAGVGLGLAMFGPTGQGAAHHLVPWTNGIVLPLFAFSAALVPLPVLGEIGPVFLALTLALPIGKTIGIVAGGTLGAWLARKHSDHAVVGWDLVALAVTGGLGFTVALLVNQLAFRGMPTVADEGVLGILAGSGISLVAGAALIAWRSRVHRARTTPPAETAGYRPARSR